MVAVCKIGTKKSVVTSIGVCPSVRVTVLISVFSEQVKWDKYVTNCKF